MTPGYDQAPGGEPLETLFGSERRLMAAVDHSLWQKARRYIACHGIGGIIEEFGDRLRYRLHDPRGTVPYHDFRAIAWDRHRGVRTAEIVECNAFDPTIPNWEHAEPYLPFDLWSFRAMFGALLDLGVRPPEFTMVDLGCGKGRAILMGAELGFHEVIGVEFQPELARCAAENLRHYRGRRRGAVSVHRGDAADFPIPPGPLVIFLYNPFRGPVMEAVAENIRHSFAEHPRNIYVLYGYPQPDSPFGRDARFKLVESGPRREIYRLVANGT
jgi:Methyltransferase domain